MNTVYTSVCVCVRVRVYYTCFLNILPENTVMTSGPVNTVGQINTTSVLLCRASFIGDVDSLYIWKFNGRDINFDAQTQYSLVLCLYFFVLIQKESDTYKSVINNKVKLYNYVGERKYTLIALFHLNNMHVFKSRRNSDVTQLAMNVLTSRNEYLMASETRCGDRKQYNYDK